MDTFKAMRAFVRSLELGSLSAAARELHTTQSAVSKLVSGLEASLGVRLFQRGSARLAPTDEARRFHERARQLLEDYEEAVAAVREQVRVPRGLLRVSAPLALGQARLNGLLLEFLSGYPEIEVELRLDDRFIDLVEEGMDVALRFGRHLPPDLIARPLCSSPRWLVAAPEYLRHRPAPARPEELASHDYLRYARAPADSVTLSNASGSVQVPVRSRYRVDSAMAILDGVLAGAGVALEPAWLVAGLVDAGRLQRLLPQWCGPSQEVFLLHVQRRQQPLRVRVLLDFLAERVAALPGMQAGAGAG
ncbi:LysR family transcriptional regulator [Eleftheria terrae]|uniref:LysR family transcriptional regulator n=1 Tax=Eleftheria terrae TaxID=1597781 RepID=UPI00263B5029|nr:LysR family transcriptional regulator [Eleftheria terrae]WKB53390.1 LysR family transcriptional regulator [Eleftheria terrae]